MKNPVVMSEIWRGAFLESVHYGHAVICDDSGQVVKTWGDPDQIILPRSSVKMIQALPLITSGAAEAHRLGPEHLALACASHQGAAIHTDRVQSWLAALGKSDDDFRCGAQIPNDKAARHDLRDQGESPCQMHNNCSGKHTGFLTLAKHLKAGPEYIDPAHPVQRACLEAFEMTTGAVSPGYGIDGCSAPNFAAKLSDVAWAMAWYASAQDRADSASQAARRLVEAMMLHPELVAGEGRACTDLMRAMSGAAAIKTGAEGVFVAILPEQRLGVALKISDGNTRASNSAIAALLCALGVLSPDHPATQKWMTPAITNWRGIETGMIKPASTLTL